MYSAYQKRNHLNFVIAIHWLIIEHNAHQSWHIVMETKSATTVSNLQATLP